MLSALAELGVNWVPLAIAGGALVLLLGVIQLILGLKAQNRPSPTGESAMIGETGFITRTQGFRNRLLVEIRGELWWCIPDSPGVQISKGDAVEVTGIEKDSMILRVKPAAC
jgi:membrane protein implicated in regulation of membrane protease activity